MGNENCHECQETTLETQAYGTHQIFQQANNVYAIVQKKVEKDPRLQAKVIKQLEMRKQINHSHIVKLQKFCVTEEDYEFRVTMYYEYIPKSLRDRIQETKQRNQPFSEREIFAIIYGIEAALVKFNELQIKHGCINLDTIMCRNNFYKLTDVSSTTYITSYDLVVKGNREQFLSEKLLQNLAHKSLNPFIELKDDLFSLGLIALMVSTGREPKNFYVWNEQGVGHLNVRAIDLSMKQMERKYSSRLGKKVKSLIYEGEMQSSQSDSTNLTDSLQELDEERSRVMSRVNKLISTTINHSAF